jgi:hypothetical protein
VTAFVPPADPVAHDRTVALAVPLDADDVGRLVTDDVGRLVTERVEPDDVLLP